MFSYGRWRTYLWHHDRSSLALDPVERVTIERLGEYVGTLESEISTTGAYIYLSRLHALVRVLAPTRDWAWLWSSIQCLNERRQPVNKRSRIVDSGRLFSLGIRLMREAQTAAVPARSCRAGALQYRDGLIIALLAARPLRLGNLSSITLSRHLEHTGDRYYLTFSAEEMKNGQPFEFGLPSKLAPYMHRYLAKVRPLFPGASRHDALWASMGSRPMGRKAIYDRICLRTKVAYGHAVNPHLFRDCVATTIAIKDPAHVEVARDILGHSRLETTERYYNQARMLDASRHYQRVILDQRVQLAHRVESTM